jgi:hypothetical protein
MILTAVCDHGGLVPDRGQAGVANRLVFMLQLTTLRHLGKFLDAPLDVPVVLSASGWAVGCVGGSAAAAVGAGRDGMVRNATALRRRRLYEYQLATLLPAIVAWCCRRTPTRTASGARR